MESNSLEESTNSNTFGNSQSAPQTSYRSYVENDSEDPPIYQENEPNVLQSIQELLGAAHVTDNDLPIQSYPIDQTFGHRRDNLDTATIRRQDIVTAYFSALKTRNDEVVAAFIESGLVTTETTNIDGRTPLLAAIEAENIRTVQQLMDFDADVNAFGVVAGLPQPAYGRAPELVERTPLMLATEKGNLTIVKLLMETYHADDSLIAPDGTLALRIAASKGHREIVDYLPSRRGGGFRRWKTKHRKMMKRVKKAGQGIYSFFQILFWELPKLVVWSVPKHTVVLPAVAGVKWIYKHWQEVPERIVRWLKSMGSKLVKLPGKMWRFLKEVPDVVKRLAKWTWRSIMKTPLAAKIVMVWVYDGIKKAGIAISDVVARLLSLVHTALTAIASFFRLFSLQDVLDGFKYFLQALIVDGPKKLWEWLCDVENMLFKVFKTAFGSVGWLIWMLIRAITKVFTYVPRKVLEIFASCAMSIASGCQEVLIYINPKRA